MTPSEQLLWQWVPPRQTLPASPCTGHQLYLPQRGSALAPQPSAICSPDFSGASPVWATLCPSPPAPTQVTGSRRLLLSGKGWTPPYAPSQLPPPTLTHTGTPTPGQLVISPHAGRGGPTPQCLETRRKVCVQEHGSSAGPQARLSLSRLKSRHFASILFFLRKQKQKSALIYLVSEERFFFLFFTFFGVRLY